MVVTIMQVLNQSFMRLSRIRFFWAICLVSLLQPLLSYAADVDISKEKEKKLQAVVKQLKAKKDKEVQEKKDLHTLKVNVSIDENLKKTMPKDASLFIYVRSAYGPNKVLAYKKFDLSKSRIDLTLNDDDAFRRLYKISFSPNIIVGARISREKDIVSSSGRVSKIRNKDIEVISESYKNTHKPVIKLHFKKASA